MAIFLYKLQKQSKIEIELCSIQKRKSGGL